MKEITTSKSVTVRIFSSQEELESFYEERGYQLVNELNVTGCEVSGDIVGRTRADALRSFHSALAEADIFVESVFDICREDACDIDNVWHIQAGRAIRDPRILNDNAVILTDGAPWPFVCKYIVWGDYRGENTFLYESFDVMDCVRYCKREGLKYELKDGPRNWEKYTGFRR